MLHFYDRATIAHALTLDLEPRLMALLTARIGALPDGLLDHTEYLVVEAGDTEADILRHIGLSPFIEPIDSLRWNEDGFEPHWDHVVGHGKWVELIFTFGSTFAYVLLIRNDPGMNDELARFCRAIAPASGALGKFDDAGRQ